MNKLFRIEIIQPKFDELYKKYQTLEEYNKDPNGFLKRSPEYIREKEDIIQNEMNKVYSNINYSDSAEKKGWEKKWDVLQTIWSFYHSNNKNTTLLIPIKSLTIKGRTSSEIDGILKGLDKEGCFWGWKRGTENYELTVIYHERLANTYGRTRDVYEKFAEEFRKKIKERTDKELSLNGWLIFHTKDDVELKFNKEKGDFVFGSVDGNFALETNGYKVFLYLLESHSHQTKYTTLLKLMYPDKDFEEPLKKYQVERWGLDSTIRDIKTTLGILPKKKSKNKDIFQTLKKWKGYKLKLTD